MTGRIEKEIVIAAPRDRVWSLVTEADHLRRWFGEEGEIDLRPGGPVVFGWDGHGAFHGVVEAVEPPSRFAYRWARTRDVPPRPGNSTRVEFHPEAYAA